MGKNVKVDNRQVKKASSGVFFGKLGKTVNVLPLLFFVVLWVVLSTYESALLFRVNELSSFIFDNLFFERMMSKPAGLLHYVSSFLVQFFYYPALGAAIYVALLYAVYCLVVKVFNLSQNYKLLALVPVVALVASNVQLGYWIFYLKQPGYYYMALVATLLFLLALWLYKCLSEPLRVLFVVVWSVVGYPLFGTYALAAALLFGLYSVVTAIADGKKILLPAVTLLVALLAVGVVPQVFYKLYTSTTSEYLYGAGFPINQWVTSYVAKVEHEDSSYWYNTSVYWIPFVVLLLSFVGLCLYVAFRSRLCESSKVKFVVASSVVASTALLLCVFWYNDNNFRIENKQNKAMWDCRWRDVAEYAKEAGVPTRQVVMNKNIALFKLGTAGAEMFAYPDGSSDILAPMSVHLSHEIH